MESRIENEEGNNKTTQKDNVVQHQSTYIHGQKFPIGLKAFIA